MNRLTISTWVLLAPLLLAHWAEAQTRQPCCSVCGQKVCVLNVSEDKESVTAFEVESKEICIPGLKLPWDKCGTRRCGGVRQICVLKEVKQEKTVCNYDWSIKTICTSCCRRHGLTGQQAQLNTDARIPYEYFVAEPLVDPLVQPAAPPTGRSERSDASEHQQFGSGLIQEVPQAANVEQPPSPSDAAAKRASWLRVAPIKWLTGQQ